MRTVLVTLAVGVAAQIPLGTAAPASSGSLGWFVGSGSSIPLSAPKAYSAEQIIEQEQTLADGTHITRTRPVVKIFRDSAGRTRNENTISVPFLVEIFDPVEGCRYVLNERTQTAHRMPIIIPSTNPVASANAPKPITLAEATTANKADNTRPYVAISHESLGTQTIEGVLAEGMRFIKTYPIGYFGKDRPLTMVTETWTSPDLRIDVLLKFSDPRTGETTVRLTNIVMAEPDPALFRVPIKYSIEDESTPGIR